MKRWAFVPETIVLFVLLDALNFLFFRADLGFRKFPLHPYWIPVLLMAGRYGFTPGIFAGSLAAVHSLVLLFMKLPTRSQLEQFAESGELLLPIAFVAVGILLGDIRQKSIRSEEEKEAVIHEKEDLLKRLKDSFESSERGRKVLEARIVGQTTTMKTLYDAASKLNALHPEDVYHGCLEILAQHFQVHRSSLYRKEGNYYELKATWGWEGGQVEGKIPCEKSIMHLAFEENRTVTVRDILARKDSHQYIDEYGKVLAMVPIRGASGEPVGIINLEQMDFLALNRPNLEMIELLADWTSQALSHVEFLAKTRAQLIRAEDDLYSYSYFQKVLQDEWRRAKHYGLDLTVAILKLERFGFCDEKAQRWLLHALKVAMLRNLEASDGLFHYQFEGTFAVIAPMRKKAEVLQDLGKAAKELETLAGREATAVGKPKLILSAIEFHKGMQQPSEMLETALKECGIAPSQ